MSLAFLSGVSLAWLLAGAAACVLPVLAHLRSKRVRTIVEFPAMQFIAKALATANRGRRLRRWILLALRLLAVTLIALAFDRPTWVSSSRASDGYDEVVFVVDASASMTRVHAGRTLFERAMGLARNELRALDAATVRAGVVFDRRTPRSILPVVTANLAALDEGLELASPTLERSDLLEAIQLASSLPSTRRETDEMSASSNRRIVVVSDFQGAEIAALKAELASVAARVEFAPVGVDAPRSNLSVRFLGSAPASPIVGAPATISFEVANHGVEHGVGSFELLIQDDSVSAGAEMLGPGEVARVSVETIFDSPGDYAVELRLTEDMAPYDDAAYGVIHVEDVRRVGMLTTDPERDEARSSFYIEQALAASPAISIERLDPLDLESWASEHPVVVVGLAGFERSHLIDALIRRHASGGATLWILDSESVNRLYAEIAARTGDMPTTPEGALLVRGRERGIRASELDLRAFPTRALEGRAGDALRGVEFSAIAPASLSLNGRSMWTLEDGRPLITRSINCQGTTIAVHADLSPRHSDLVRSPVFPVLMLELMRSLTETEMASRDVLIGESLGIAVQGPSSFVPPAIVETGERVGSRRVGSRLRLLVESPANPGHVIVRDSSGVDLATFAANVDHSESDLESPSIEELAALESDMASSHSTDSDFAPTEDAVATGVMRTQSIQLWPSLILAGIFVLAIESLIAGRGRHMGLVARTAS